MIGDSWNPSEDINASDYSFVLRKLTWRNAMIEGSKVSEMFSLVGRYAKEIEALCEALENSLVENLNSKESPRVVAGDAAWEYRADDSDWIYTDVGCSIPLKSSRKNNKRAKAYICIQISMTGEGAGIAEHAEPLLHVGLWGDPICFKEGKENFMSFPMNHFELASAIIDERLLSWKEDDAEGLGGSDWIYSLRLLSINSIDDLQAYVVAPVMALLQEKDIREALPDAWLDKQLVRYRQSEIGIS